MSLRLSSCKAAVWFGFVVAMCSPMRSMASVTIEDAVAKLKSIEEKADAYAFEIEAKLQYLEPKTDKQAGTQHFKITYDQMLFRRSRLSVFHLISPWPDNPSGSGLSDLTGEYAILGDSYQSLLLADGDPDPRRRAYPLDGRVSSKSRPYQFITAFFASGWRGSLFGMTFSGRESKLSDFIERCVDAKKAATAGAIAEISSDANGFIQLRLCADNRSYIYDITLDPKMGMGVKRWSEIYPKNGQVLNDLEMIELSEIEDTGLYFPKRLISQDFDSEGVPIGKLTSELVSVRVIRKETLSDNDFQIDWPVGSKVMNEETGERVVIGPKPEESKKAVAKSVREMKELAAQAQVSPSTRQTASVADSLSAGTSLPAAGPVQSNTFRNGSIVIAGLGAAVAAVVFGRKIGAKGQRK